MAVYQAKVNRMESFIRTNTVQRTLVLFADALQQMIDKSEIAPDTKYLEKLRLYLLNAPSP